MSAWRSDVPADAGWYVASIERDADAHRWWDGVVWSAPVYPEFPKETHDRARSTVGETQHGVEWLCRAPIT